MKNFKINKKSLILGIFIIVMVILISFVSTHINKSQENYRYQQKILLKERISNIQTQANPILDLGQEFSFSWDTVYMFPPYISSEKVNKDLGFFWVDYFFTNISYDEGITLLVFTENGSVVMYLEFPRDAGDFSLTGKKKYTRDEAVFYIDEMKRMSNLNK